MYSIAFYVLSILDVQNLEELKAMTQLPPKIAILLYIDKS